MAVSVDKVYQKVLAIANKEQRGYITPQEFNLFADHAQMDIFEQYFYDLEQRQKRGTGNESDYADIVTNIEEKISIFELYNQSVGNTNAGIVYISSNVTNFYRLGTVHINYNDGTSNIAEQIQINELNKYKNSPLATWTKSRPVYSKFSTNADPVTIQVYPDIDITSVSVSCVKRPNAPNWTYLIGSNKNALYNPNAADHKHFELHSSEETNLVVKILQLAGVAIKDFNLAQAAAQEEVKSIQLEKQ